MSTKVFDSMTGYLFVLYIRFQIYFTVEIPWGAAQNSWQALIKNKIEYHYNFVAPSRKYDSMFSPWPKKIILQSLEGYYPHFRSSFYKYTYLLDVIMAKEY